MSYMRVTRGRIDPARFDELNKLGQEIAATIRRLPGNQSYVAGVDLASGRAQTVSIWDTEEDARRETSPAPTSHPGSRLSAYNSTHQSSLR